MDNSYLNCGWENFKYEQNSFGKPDDRIQLQFYQISVDDKMGTKVATF